MAIFKDKTGRGEVEYTKRIQSNDGTNLNISAFGDNCAPHGIPAQSASSVVFQLRGNSNGVEDVSNSSFTVNEISGSLTKRLESVTHTQKLKSFEFSGGKVLTLTASLDVSNFEDLNVIPSGDSASDKFGSTYLPYGNEGHGSYSSISPGPVFCVLSGWIYLNDSGTAMCVMESVNESNGKRAFGLATSSNNELIWRYYDWNHSSAHTSSTVQQVKTTKKLNPKKWYHFAIIFFGYAGSSETARVYNSNGLDERHQLFVSPSAARVATTADLAATYNNGSSGVGATLTANANGAIAIDGVSLSANDRVLVKSQQQGTEHENGLYKVTTVGDGSSPFVLTRTTDADTPVKLKSLAERSERTRLVVTEGASNADAGYVITGGDSITAIGTSSIFFSQFSSVGNPSLLSGAQVEIYIDGAKSNVSEYGATSGTIANGVTVAASNLPIVIGRGLTEEDGSSVNTFGTFSGRLAEISYFYFYLEALLDTGTNVDSRGFEQDPRGPQDWESYKLRLVNALKTGKKSFASGLSNPPERLLLREIDQNSTHPTVKRSGDQRRLGNHAIRFDDGRAQTLKGSTVSYPQKLVPGDQLFDTIFNGYPGNAHNLTIAHTASVEAYDTFYRRNDQPSHEPFVESRIYIDSGSIFYQTGTLESVLPGFDKPLASKDVITIDLNCNGQTLLGHNNRLVGDSKGFGVGLSANFMSYYNMATSQFDPLYGWTPTGGTKSYSVSWNAGISQTDSAINQRFFRNISGSCIGFQFNPQALTASNPQPIDVQHMKSATGRRFSDLGPSQLTNSVIDYYPDALYHASGQPTSNYGFPDDVRYNSSGSASNIAMSDYITEPFLLEKISVQFSEIGIKTQYDMSADVTGRDGFPGAEFAFTTTVVSGTGGDAVVNQFQSGKFTDGFQLLTSFFMVEKPQFKNDESFSIDVPMTYSVVDSDNTFSVKQIKQKRTFTKNKERHLISYGQTMFVDGRTDAIYNPHTYSNYATNKNGSQPAGTNIRAPGDVNDQRFGSSNNISPSLTNYGDIIAAAPYRFESIIEGTQNQTGSYTIEMVPKIINSSPLTGKSVNQYIKHHSETGRAVEIFQWKGGRSSILDTLGPSRHIARAHSSQSDPRQIELLTFSGFNETLPDSTVDDNKRGVFAESVEIADQADNKGLYLLMPEDELIFGLQASSFLDIAQAVPSSVSLINGSKIKIQFFGSYLRNSQPRQFQLNQLLNNDIVHEAVGQEPIADQFDVEPRAAFSGSYVDEVMSGSSVGPLYNGFNALSHVNGPGSNATTSLARMIGGRSSQGNLGTTGSLRRNVAIASSDKTEFDSFLFDLQSMFKVDLDKQFDDAGLKNTEKVRNYVNDADFGSQKIDRLLFGNFQTLDGTATGIHASLPSTPARHIRGSYLMDLFHDVTRVRGQQIGGGNDSFLIVISGSGSPASYAPFFAQNLGTDATSYNSGRFIVRGPEPATTADPFLDSTTVSKLIFGLGEGSNNEHVLSDNAVSNPDYQTFSETIRGFRYGLSNIFDRKPRNIFRRDRYGQLRDMLEMAPNTAYIDDKTNTIVRAIEAQFFADDGSIISPEATSCSNLSTFVTSSAPFFDREVVNFEDTEVVRNRGPINNKVADITIEI